LPLVLANLIFTAFIRLLANHHVSIPRRVWLIAAVILVALLLLTFRPSGGERQQSQSAATPGE
jgi:hypothetical protein